MTQTVSVPGVGDLDFPDDMSEQDMAAAIQKNFPQVHRPDDSKLEKIGKEIARQFGLTARYAVEGITALPNMIGDVLGLKSSGAVSGALTKAGLPEPQGATERVVGDVSRGMAGAVPFVSGGQVAAQASRPIMRQIGKFISEAPGMQVTAGGAGAGAAGAAREEGTGPVGETAAGLAGALVAPLGAAGVKAAARGAIRGGEASRAAGASRIRQFEDAGTTPSAAQAFQTHGSQGTEAFLARDPGGHGVMIDFAERQAAQIGKKVDDVAGILAGKTSPMVAGQAIEEGITGAGGFLDRFKATSKILYDKLDSYVPGDSQVKVTNTQQTLARLTKPTPGAEETSKLLVNSKVLQISEALESDIRGGKVKTVSILGSDDKPISTIKVSGKEPAGAIPYSALKELRSKVGEMLSDSELISDAPRRQLKQLYAALSADMRHAVDATGSKEAKNAFQRANTYTRAGHQRIDDLLQPILDKTSPEKMFQAALSGTKEGDTMVRGVMQSLPEKQQKILAATILRKLGKATSSKQGAAGDVFSVDTYLTNWNNISAQAKRSLFSRFGQKFVGDLDTIAKTAEDIREGGRVYANPSGTAPALTLQHTVGGIVLLTLTGNVKTAAALGAEMAMANGSARLMTNPRFVGWLAKQTRAPAEALPTALNELAQQASQSKDDDLMAFVESMRK